MMTCTRCGCDRLRTEIMERYEDDGMVGLPGVSVLNAARKYICKECGEENGISIPNEEGLEAAVAVYRVGILFKLNGQEIRFLRKSLGLAAKELADRMQVADETVSRWEHDKLPMGPQHEKVFRVMVGRGLKERAPAVGFDEDAILKGQIQSIFPNGRPELKMSFRQVQILSKPAWAEPIAA